MALEAWRPWLIPASQGPSETLRPEDCTGPLFRGLRPLRAQQGQAHITQRVLGDGTGAGLPQVSARHTPWALVSCPDARPGQGNKERTRPAVGAQRGGPSPVSPAG